MFASACLIACSRVGHWQVGKPPAEVSVTPTFGKWSHTPTWKLTGRFKAAVSSRTRRHFPADRTFRHEAALGEIAGRRFQAETESGKLLSMMPKATSRYSRQLARWRLNTAWWVSTPAALQRFLGISRTPGSVEVYRPASEQCTSATRHEISTGTSPLRCPAGVEIVAQARIANFLRRAVRDVDVAQRTEGTGVRKDYFILSLSTATSARRRLGTSSLTTASTIRRHCLHTPFR